MRLTWLADVLRAADLFVVEEPGWQTRGKDFPGAIEGVMGHHTASAAGKNCPSINTLINGRPDLAGPLAQVGLCRDGVVHIIAAGVANHAGSGGLWPGILLGNKDSIGIEAENNGLGESWGETQMECYVRLAAALLEQIKRGPERFCTHYEWTTRKIDAAGPWIGGGDWYDGGTVAAQSNADAFRARVEDAMGGMTDAQEAKLDKVLKLLDDYFGIDENGVAKDIRLKIDSTYIEVAGDDHDDTLAGRVQTIEEAIPDTAVIRQQRRDADDALHAVGGDDE
jgi:hypothetical protein